MTPPLQAADRLELLESSRRVAGDVLDKAHDKGFVVSGLYHLRRNARLPQGLEGLNTALPADQNIASAIGT